VLDSYFFLIVTSTKRQTFKFPNHKLSLTIILFKELTVITANS